MKGPSTNFESELRFKLSKASIFERNSITPDDWQSELLNSTSKRIAVCCSRQAGKTTTAAAKAIHVASNQPNLTIAIVAPSQDQSAEILRRCVELIHGAGLQSQIGKETTKFLQFRNGSRILALQGSRPETLRGLTLDFLILDEAANVPDDVFIALLPMLLVRPDSILIALSTPAGRRGWYFTTFHDDSNGWQKIRIPATEIDRIPQAELAAQRRVLGEIKFRQEFLCDFTADDTLLIDPAILDRVFQPAGVLM